jgi:hypothetical protein
MTLYQDKQLRYPRMKYDRIVHWVYKTQRVVKTKHKKHNTENLKVTRTPPKNREWTQVLAKCKEFLPKYAMSLHIKILGAKTNRASFYANITVCLSSVSSAVCALCPWLPVSLQFAPGFYLWCSYCTFRPVCVFTFLVPCFNVHYDFGMKTIFRSSYPDLFVEGLMSYLWYSCARER